MAAITLTTFGNRENGRRVVIFAALAAAVWIFWAIDPLRWTKALDARRFALPLALPFYFGLWWTMKNGVPRRLHFRNVAFTSVLIFAAVLTIQSSVWKREFTKVLTRVENDPRSVLPVEDFADLRGTPLDHWGLGPQIIARFGGRKLILNAKSRAVILENPPRVEVGYDALVAETPGPLGWFEFREAVRDARMRTKQGETPSR